MPIDSTNFIGIFIDYYGFESIYYAYCKIKLIEDYYILDNFYTNLDITGIGSFKYEKVINLNNNEFYIISHESGEGIESIALHYFPYNFHNKTYTLEKCFPSSEDEPHDEKLEYKYDYENGTIYIEKYEIERDKEKEWRILSQKKTNLIDIIKKLRESS